MNIKREFEEKFIVIDNPDEEDSGWRWKNIHFLRVIEWIESKIEESKVSGYDN